MAQLPDLIRLDLEALEALETQLQSNSMQDSLNPDQGPNTEPYTVWNGCA